MKRRENERIAKHSGREERRRSWKRRRTRKIRGTITNISRNTTSTRTEEAVAINNRKRPPSSSSRKKEKSPPLNVERRWSKFDQRWESLDASSSTSRLPLTYNDIPWLPKMAKLLERKISERQDASDATVLKKKVYRELIMRWHRFDVHAKVREEFEPEVTRIELRNG